MNLNILKFNNLIVKFIMLTYLGLCIVHYWNIHSVLIAYWSWFAIDLDCWESNCCQCSKNLSCYTILTFPVVYDIDFIVISSKILLLVNADIPIVKPGIDPFIGVLLHTFYYNFCQANECWSLYREYRYNRRSLNWGFTVVCFYQKSYELLLLSDAKPR